MNKTIYDILGVGIGPFNLSLAALSSSISDCKSIFLDARSRFNWHPGMMLEGTRLQTPFMSDLVTMADPTNEYSFLNYSKLNGHLYPFYIRENFFLVRKEYNQYCQWACNRLPNLKFNSCVTMISYDENEALYCVQTQDTLLNREETYYCHHLVLGTGTQPYLPDFCNEKEHEVIHSANYLMHKAELKKSTCITVVGSGQSAAEIFYDLLTDIDIEKYRLRWLTRSPRFFPLEYTKLTLEMTSPEYIDYFHQLEPEQRRALIKKQKHLYKGINADLINDIYDLLYIKRLSHDCAVEMMTNISVNALSYEKSHVILKCQHSETHNNFQLESEHIVMATGYEYQLPQFLDGISSNLRFDSHGELDVQRNYSVDRNNKIFVQNVGLHTHGLTSPDLGMVCYRNATILNQVLGRTHYKVEKSIAFQQFSPPNCESHLYNETTEDSL